jgi:adenylosuccinate synthase
MKVDPLNMLVENEALQTIGITDAFQRTTIDRLTPIITPFHKMLNRLREQARGDARHGSCGLGIGELQSDIEAGRPYLRAGDLDTPALLRHTLRLIQQQKLEQVRKLDTLADPIGAAEMFTSPLTIDLLIRQYHNWLTSGITTVDGRDYLGCALDAAPVIFEGAQGILLDEDYGFHPYTTWSKTTTAHAETLLHEAGYSDHITRLGILRAYMTRHGPGPLVTENKRLTDFLPDTHNTFGEWQGDFRVGMPDLVMARYAIEANRGIDELAITNIDRWAAVTNKELCIAYDLPDWPFATRIVARPGGAKRTIEKQETLTQSLLDTEPVYASVNEDYLNVLSAALHVPITIRSYGPTAADKRTDD